MDYLSEFSRSYERILGASVQMKSERAEQFFEYFYQHFLGSSQEVRDAFRGTDISKQAGMLKRSLFFSVGFISSQESSEFMEKIGRAHSRKEHDIAAPLYELWMTSMVAAVEKYDPECSESVKLAWCLALAPAVSYMKYLHDK
jgi:hemoglobin-like flavoprotein